MKKLNTQKIVQKREIREKTLHTSPISTDFKYIDTTKEDAPCSTRFRFV